LKRILLFLDWYDYRIHRGVAQVARDAGWHLVCPKSNDQKENTLESWDGDGCIALSNNPERFEPLSRRNIPLVDLGLSPHELPASRLVTDNFAIGRLAAEHFQDRGYSEVFLEPTHGVAMFEERLSAFKEKMEERKGKVTVLSDQGGPWAKQFLQKLGQVATERNSSLKEVSWAVLAYEDSRAAELVTLCLQEGVKIPQNLAILGIDNDDLINDGLAVPISSVDSDQEGLGRKAAEILRQRLDQPDLKWNRELQRHSPKGVIIRESTSRFAVRHPLLAESLQWICENFHKGVQAVDVARAMKVTQQRLQKEFASHHMRSLAEEIRYQRVEATSHHLLHSSLNISDIAELCGFYTVDSLITNFKKIHGITPGQFRKQHLPQDT